MEPALLYSDEEATYVANEKGSDALYRLAKATGTRQFNGLIAKFLQISTKTDVPVDPQLFYRSLKGSLPEKNQALLKTLFEDTALQH
jgi:hypothetical protein